MASQFDAIVIGAGAAGLMCALTAGQRGRRVLVLDHANKVGKKILMSGGGRCNFTNTGTTPDNFLSANPHFCKSALARYTPWHFIELVERHGIAYHEKELGQQFCDESSKQIVKLLLDECAAVGVEVRTQLQHRTRRPARCRRLQAAHLARHVRYECRGGRQRRPVDPEHGRQRFWLHACEAVRP